VSVPKTLIYPKVIPYPRRKRTSDGRCHCVSPKWVTVEVMGIPYLICAKCGKGLPKPIAEGTMTHKEMHKAQKPKPKFRSWQEELHYIMEELWERKYGSKSNPKR